MNGDVIQRVKCWLGFHDWPSAWVEEQRWPGGKRSVKECENCGFKKYKVVSNIEGPGQTEFEEFTENDPRVSGSGS